MIMVRAIFLSLLAWAVCFTSSQAVAQDAESDLTTATIALAQEVLSVRGYDLGPADGQIGRKTVAAIRDFQAANDLTETGRLDPDTLRALGVPMPNAASAPSAPPAVPVAPVALETLTENPEESGIEQALREAEQAAQAAAEAAALVEETPDELTNPPANTALEADEPATPNAPMAANEPNEAPVNDADASDNASPMASESVDVAAAENPNSGNPEAVAGAAPHTADASLEQTVAAYVDRGLEAIRSYWWALIMLGLVGFSAILVHR